MIKKKFILEFDEMPQYVIVSGLKGLIVDVYENGEKVEGLISVQFEGSVNDAPTIRLEKFGTKTSKG